MWMTSTIWLLCRSRFRHLAMKRAVILNGLNPHRSSMPIFRQCWVESVRFLFWLQRSALPIRWWCPSMNGQRKLVWWRCWAAICEIFRQCFWWRLQISVWWVASLAWGSAIWFPWSSTRSWRRVEICRACPIFRFGLPGRPWSLQ